ncbi:MAG: hypothetical protein IKU94_09245 [Bacteroidaceae bacterium]|nr:hypothetical protein [Bacteroidaceae bacterium]
MTEDRHLILRTTHPLHYQIRKLNRIKYTSPLSVEWENGGMNRENGAAESLRYVKQIGFEPSEIAFDASFQKE